MREALPEEIANDPRYWRETTSYIVKTYRVARSCADSREQPPAFELSPPIEPEMSLIDEGDI